MANILIIDDQEWVLDLFSESLLDEGHNISTTDDIKSVMSNVSSFKPDLVLLNLYLKHGFNVWDVLQDIKKQDSTLPVIIVTTSDTYLYGPRLSQANGYTIKSWLAPDELKQKISIALGRKTKNHLEEAGPFI